MQLSDVLVIGGGIAGIAAALEAAAEGSRTILLRPGPGATGMTSGGWTGAMSDRVARALSAAGLPHTGTNHVIPHPAGTLCSFDYAPLARAAAEPTEGTLVCGIAGLPGFHAPGLARLWGGSAGVSLEPRTLAAGPATPAAGWSPVALAAALERDAGPLADSLAGAVRESGAIRAIMPAVLGREGAGVRETLADAAGVPVGEALAGPGAPSLPGWRLDRALLHAAEAAGIQIVRARAVAREMDGRRIRAVLAHRGGAAEPGETNGGPIRFRADAVVLATGKFTGGGIAAGDVLEEPALDCPVWVEHTGVVFERNEPLALTAAARAADQPLLTAGVHTDDSGRPVNRWGDVVYDNVFVAGSVRAGRIAAEPGLGIDAEDGAAAGKMAAEFAGGAVNA